VHVVLAPVTTFVTVNTVPNGSDGLAHFPGGAALYHVACPRSPAPVAMGGAARGATLGAAVVVVTGTASTGAAVCCPVTGAAGDVVAVVEGGVVGAGGPTVVDVVDPGTAASKFTTCEGRTTP
jgi:hypothetical protein